jgi:MFS family permease
MIISDEEKFKLSDLKTFNREFWIISVSCAITYMAIFPPMQILTNLLSTKYAIPAASAPVLFGLPYIISASTSPFLGFLIDKIGYRPHLSKIFYLLIIISFLIIIITIFQSHHYNAITTLCRSMLHISVSNDIIRSRLFNICCCSLGFNSICC